MNILFGLLGIGVAFLLTQYRRHIIGFTGPWGWAEKYLGSGRSETACVLLGVVIFFFSVTMMTGMLDDIVKGILGPLISSGKEG